LHVVSHIFKGQNLPLKNKRQGYKTGSILRWAPTSKVVIGQYVKGEGVVRVNMVKYFLHMYKNTMMMLGASGSHLQFQLLRMKRSGGLQFKAKPGK
jgi:hypothetical protein